MEAGSATQWSDRIISRVDALRNPINLHSPAEKEFIGKLSSQMVAQMEAEERGEQWDSPEFPHEDLRLAISEAVKRIPLFYSRQIRV